MAATDVLRLIKLVETDEPPAVDVAETVAERIGHDGSADRQLRKLLKRASEVEFVHLGAGTGKRPLDRPPGS